jgi:hypothetical protein
VRITSSGFCASDLHLLDGFIPTMEKGDVSGRGVVLRRLLSKCEPVMETTNKLACRSFAFGPAARHRRSEIVLCPPCVFSFS